MRALKARKTAKVADSKILPVMTALPEVPAAEQLLFQSNDEYLQAWCGFMETLKDPGLFEHKPVIPSGKASFAEKFAALNMRSEKSFAAGVNIPLERLVAEKNLIRRKNSCSFL
jgi:hypothetical protein